MKGVLIIVALSIVLLGCAREGPGDGLTNPCAAVSCLEGSECVVVDGEGVCEPASGEPMVGEDAFTECAGERPEICTREYNPVCGNADGEWSTYGNACEACADTAVQGYRPGECGA